MKAVRPLTLISAALTLAVTGASSASPAEGPPLHPKTVGRYNVLFLTADDMRWDISGYTNEGSITPNLAKLASDGLRFEHAFTQYPVCNPSRTAFATGRYPTATGLVVNGTHHFRTIHPHLITLPEHFKNNGYVSANAGKFFHGRAQDPQSWTEFHGSVVPAGHAVRAIPMDDEGKEIPLSNRSQENREAPTVRYRVLPHDGDGDADNWIAAKGIDLLEKYREKPFFIAIGFHCPHAPPKAPQRFFDLYQPGEMKLPEDFATRPTVPPHSPTFMLPPNNDTFYMPNDVSPALARRIIAATRAATSYADWNIGRVLEALERLDLAKNTIVVFTSDHGYHLGEKGRWGKTSSFDIALRVPLIIRVPGREGGRATIRTVQLIDLYPTLADLCGLPIPEGLQGRSLAPLINDPTAQWDHPALSMSRTAGAALGYSARTEKFRYTEWREGEEGAALFDLENDPHSTRNLAADPEYAETVQALKQALRDGFGQMPPRIVFPKKETAVSGIQDLQ